MGLAVTNSAGIMPAEIKPAEITPTGIRHVAVLGATGSIGTSALDVIARHPQRLRASVLAAGRNVDALVALCRTHRPQHAVIADSRPR